jgi:hypothetical protein
LISFRRNSVYFQVNSYFIPIEFDSTKIESNSTRVEFDSIAPKQGFLRLRLDFDFLILTDHIAKDFSIAEFGLKTNLRGLIYVIKVLLLSLQ